jgi:hypothetical protein
MDMLMSVQWKICEEVNIQVKFVTTACHLGSFYEFVVITYVWNRIIQQITGHFVQHIDFDTGNLIH